MLERIAADLLPGIEAITQDERTTESRGASPSPAIFCLSIILTNATLYVARFDPVRLNLETGVVPEAELDFEEVPLIRFRKALRAHYPGTVPVDPHKPALESLNDTRTRSIVIINSRRMGDSLKSLQFPSWRSPSLGQWIERIAYSRST
jgi:hypothetical protein